MKTLLLAAALLTATPALAQDAVRAQLGKCLAIPGVLQRLACYDALAKGYAPGTPAPARAPALASAAPPPAAYIPPPPAYVPPAAPASQFGGERLAPSPTAPKRASSIVAEIVKFENNVRGKFILTLSNGQVWKQINGDDAIARPRKSAHSVTIEKAIFDSYALTFNDSPMRYKVTRIQ